MASSLTKVSTSNGDALSSLLSSLSEINNAAGSDTSAAKKLLGQLQSQDYSGLITNILNQATNQSTLLGARYANATGASASGNSVLQNKLSQVISQATAASTQAVTDAQLKNQQIQAQLAAMLAQAKAGDPALAKVLKTLRLANAGSKMINNKSLLDNLKGLMGGSSASVDPLWAQALNGTGTDLFSSGTSLGLDTANLPNMFADMSSWGTGTDVASSLLSGLSGVSSVFGDLGTTYSLGDAVASLGDLGYGSLGMSAADMGFAASDMAGSMAAINGASAAAEGASMAGSALSNSLPILAAMNWISDGMIGEGIGGAINSIGDLAAGAFNGIGNFFSDLFGW